MTTARLAILVQCDFVSGTVRLWDGSGPLMAGGYVWKGAGLVPTGLDELELALNGEASSLDITLAAVGESIADTVYADYQAGDLVGALVTISLQDMDDAFQPSGSPVVYLTGEINNARFSEASDSSDPPQQISQVTISIANRFNLRNMPLQGVYSDADHQLQHPGDTFFEFVPLMLDKTIVWPNW